MKPTENPIPHRRSHPYWPQNIDAPILTNELDKAHQTMVFRKRDVLFSSSSDSMSASSKDHSYKPLPLKQRTSSTSDRRDFTSNTWVSLLELIKFREYLIPVNHFSIWRRHNAWAFEDGKDLRSYIGNRYASNMVFMSLLLSTEFGVLFNSAKITTQVRDDLVEAHWHTTSFWAGLFIIISSLCTILSLISTFTFTAMISAIDERNAHCILRSSIGQYATELPGRLIVCSIYTFLISFMLFFFLLLPVGVFSIVLLLGTVFFFVHVVSVFSSFGRIIMHTGAMGRGKIFSSEYEELLVPDSLHSHLLSKARSNLKHKISIRRQYRTKQCEIDRFLLDTEYYDHLCGNNKPHVSFQTPNDSIPDISFTPGPRLRADSKVRFADEESGLMSNRIGSKIGNMPGSRHEQFRSLTPLSDISDHSRPSIGEIPSARSTDDNDLGGLSSLAVPPKKFFVDTDRGGRESREISDLSTIHSVQNVSNTSLEQWLQGSSSDIGTQPGKDVSSKKMSFESISTDEKKDIESMGLPSPVQTPAPVSAPTSTKPSTINRNVKSIDTNEVAEVMTMPLIDSDSLRLQRAHERDMSEAQRFAFDYGDIASDNGSASPRKSMSPRKTTAMGYGTGNNHVVQNTSDGRDQENQNGDDKSSTQDERTRLLK